MNLSMCGAGQDGCLSMLTPGSNDGHGTRRNWDDVRIQKWTEPAGKGLTCMHVKEGNSRCGCGVSSQKALDTLGLPQQQSAAAAHGRWGGLRIGTGGMRCVDPKHTGTLAKRASSHACACCVLSHLGLGGSG
jgi:hypothetical protein